MENANINVKLKKVGNSLAFFIPADVKNRMHLQPKDEVVAYIRKKKIKDKKAILSISGALKGKKIAWSCKEDRFDEERD